MIAVLLNPIFRAAQLLLLRHREGRTNVLLETARAFALNGSRSAVPPSLIFTSGAAGYGFIGRRGRPAHFKKAAKTSPMFCS